MERDEKVERNPAEPAQNEEAAQDERASSFSRRALIHAGWTVPVILTVAPPRAFAQSPHTDGGVHGDSHQDAHDDTMTGNVMAAPRQSDSATALGTPETHSDAHSDRG